MSDILIYETEDQKVEVRLERETVWLNRQQMAELFGRDVKTIGKHVNNVFREGELEKNAVVANFATTAADGKTYQVEHYNLDVIISVGYRVKSLHGTQFRIWATRRLRDYLLKGYAIVRQRLEQNARELEQARKAEHLKPVVYQPLESYHAKHGVGWNCPARRKSFQRIGSSLVTNVSTQ